MGTHEAAKKTMGISTGHLEDEGSVTRFCPALFTALQAPERSTTTTNTTIQHTVITYLD
jgi:hypothetical protein